MSNDRYNDREISWLKFNERVLYEALDDTNPIMERLKLLAISASNLDEFFMVRVSGIKKKIDLGYNTLDYKDYTTKEQLGLINNSVKSIYAKQQEILISLKQELEKSNIFIDYEKDDEMLELMENIFINDILPILSPITLDRAHPFPFIYNKRFSIIVRLKKLNKEYLSLIMIPENIKRIYKVKKNDGSTIILKLEDIILSNLLLIYKGYKIISSDYIRVTRNADLEVQKEEAEDLMQVIEDSISKRDKGNVARIEINSSMHKKVIDILKKKIDFNDNDIFIIDGDIDLTYLFQLYSLLPSKQFPAFKPFTLANIPTDNKIFDYIKKRDIILLRPYYSFSLVSDLISIASTDDDVLAIKMTLYRTNTDSKILTSLIEAAKRGKQVSVVVELKARFDEELNISWARNLEQSGCIVSYGIPELKVHSKAMIIIRREDDVIKRYTHIATGNYNENTAMIYTDIDFITADDQIGYDISDLFNYLMSYTDMDTWRSIFVAPFNLRERIIDLIDTVAKDRKFGRKSSIVMKMNSLVDTEVIDHLYDASSKGVKIDLIIRGICCLKSGVPKLSNNISVRSIVGRFLEHSRIFYFKSSTIDKLFISSADVMPRNLNGRVEIMVEITDTECKKNILDYIDISLKDNSKSWILTDDKYMKNINNNDKINSQEFLLNKKIIN